MSLNCPACSLLSPDDAEQCDCGWSFKQRTMLAKYERVSASPIWSVLAYLATILTGFAWLAILYAGGGRGVGGAAILTSLTAWLWAKSRGRVIRLR